MYERKTVGEEGNPRRHDRDEAKEEESQDGGDIRATLSASIGSIVEAFVR